MSDAIQCKRHGAQSAAFVCWHILETLDDEAPRGFHWGYHDGAYDAICSSCNALSDDAWAETSGELIRMVCSACFRRAGAINGHDLPVRPPS